MKKQKDVTRPGPSKSNAAPPAPPLQSTVDFYQDDFARTLFPLKTNLILMRAGEQEIRGYIAKCLDANQNAFSFYAQRRVYAAKAQMHLRRTVKLDVISEFYLYDIVFRNRKLFRRPHTTRRTNYGYRFEAGRPVSPTSAYKGFKGALSEYGKLYNSSVSFDIASYFNSIYHHDLVSWFAELGANDEDVAGFSQLLREINSGRSVDCLPQGLYPAKMIGNDFLRFVDNSHRLKSSQLVRFMDDFYLFSDDESQITEDFISAQQLLGEKGLSVNPKKTARDTSAHVKVEQEIDLAKRQLLKRRRQLVMVGYDENDQLILQENFTKHPLSEKELGVITAILYQQEMEEEDVELILTTMRDQTSAVEKRLPYIIDTFPNLAKSVYQFSFGVTDREFLAGTVLEYIKRREQIVEFQLFWFCVMLDELLLSTSKCSELIDLLFNHRSSTSITKAKILEIPDQRFGLSELRHDFLVNGQSDWLAWASAVGSRTLHPTSRNHVLKYFAKGSNMNDLVATIICK